MKSLYNFKLTQMNLGNTQKTRPLFIIDLLMLIFHNFFSFGARQTYCNCFPGSDPDNAGLCSYERVNLTIMQQKQWRVKINLDEFLKHAKSTPIFFHRSININFSLPSLICGARWTHRKSFPCYKPVSAGKFNYERVRDNLFMNKIIP